jgi:hypothetical protein
MRASRGEQQQSRYGAQQAGVVVRNQNLSRCLDRSNHLGHAERLVQPVFSLVAWIRIDEICLPSAYRSNHKKSPTLWVGLSVCLFGGDRRDRTADLLIANQTLSQLSYAPKTPRILCAATGSVNHEHPQCPVAWRNHG